MPSPQLSVLDLSIVGRGSTPALALDQSRRLAQEVEGLGYHRYWVAEHHNMPGIASSSPPVLIAHLAAHTTTLRLGSGGVMLPNHSPLVVAEQFGMLEALHPGSDRPGPGTGAGHRRADGRRPAAHQPLRRRGGVPPPAGRAARLLQRHVPRRPPVQVDPRHPGPGLPAGRVAAGVEPLQRPAGRAPRPAVLVRPPLLGREHRGRGRGLPPVLRPLRRARPALRDAGRERAGGADARRGPLPGRPREAGDGPPAHGEPRRLPDARGRRDPRLLAPGGGRGGAAGAATT